LVSALFGFEEEVIGTYIEDSGCASNSYFWDGDKLVNM